MGVENLSKTCTTAATGVKNLSKDGNLVCDNKGCHVHYFKSSTCLFMIKGRVFDMFNVITNSYTWHKSAHVGPKTYVIGQAHYDSVKGKRPEPEEEVEEVAVVVMSDTVCHPRAVMIHPRHTPEINAKWGEINATCGEIKAK
jgi:hypothetical protein